MGFIDYVTIILDREMGTNSGVLMVFIMVIIMDNGTEQVVKKVYDLVKLANIENEEMDL